jgi:hypothetical protein
VISSPSFSRVREYGVRGNDFNANKFLNEVGHSPLDSLNLDGLKLSDNVQFAREDALLTMFTGQNA